MSQEKVVPRSKALGRVGRRTDGRDASGDDPISIPDRECYDEAMKADPWPPVDRILYIRQHEAMKTISYTEARNRLAQLMAETTEDREPVAITRNGTASVVLVDAEEYASMTETLALLSSPTNAARLRKGLKEFKRGRFKRRLHA